MSFRASRRNRTRTARTPSREPASRGVSKNKVYVIRRARTELLEDAGSADSSAIGATEDNEERSVRSRLMAWAFFERPLKTCQSALAVMRATPDSSAALRTAAATVGTRRLLKTDGTT